MKAKKSRKSAPEAAEQKVSIYPAWCKRCGNCVAFCPREALEKDEWGYPYLARPDRCISCHMCEMLCPDFAISVGEAGPRKVGEAATGAASAGGPESQVGLGHGPERIAPAPVDEEDQDG